MIKKLKINYQLTSYQLNNLFYKNIFKKRIAEFTRKKLSQCLSKSAGLLKI